MYEAGRWSLSPAYDLNPVPEIDRVRINKTPISNDLLEPSISTALEVAGRFGLRFADAKRILREVVRPIRNWRETARALRLKPSTISAYESAFEHDLIVEAERLSVH